MLQQINLYDFLPQKEVSLLNKKFVLIIYGIFIFVLILFYLLSVWHTHALNIQLDALNSEVGFMQNKLTKLVQQYPILDKEALKKNIDQLEQDYRQQFAMINLLSPYANFSDYLIGLGNAIVPGVWLTEIRFNRKDVNIELSGFTLQPALLERFFIQLSTLPIFSDFTFKVNAIKQMSFPTSFYITAKQMDNP